MIYLLPASPKHKSDNLSHSHGFTLIELVVYATITSAVMMAAIDFSYQFLDSLSRIQTAAAVEETGNLTLQIALYDFDRSLPVILPTTPIALPITNTIVSTSSISFSIISHDFSFTPFIENK